MKNGYTETTEGYTCLCCGLQIEKGLIYPVGERLYDANKYLSHHIEHEHGSVFAHLVQLDQRMTGLSSLQQRVLTLFFAGKSDAEIKAELGMGSTSTVRNHRFVLREKERQARLFLAIMELLRERQAEAEPSPTPSTGNRSRQGGSREGRLLERFFPFGTEGPLRNFTTATPEKQRRMVAAEVASRFQMGRRYTEQEVNQILEPIAEDYLLLRRCLVDFGLLDRKPDGSQYWRTETVTERGVSTMDRKKELKRLAREIKVEGGIYQIRNTRNGKVLVEATPDLKTINGKAFQLRMGSHMNRQLQEEWNQFGADAFRFEVLEVLEEPETGYFDKAEALKRLKEQWVEQLQPYGEKGYH